VDNFINTIFYDCTNTEPSKVRKMTLKDHSRSKRPRMTSY